MRKGLRELGRLSTKELMLSNCSGEDSGLPGGLDGRESACSAGDPSSIPGSGRSPGEGNGNPLQYSCLENSMGRGAWWATHGVTESDPTEVIEQKTILRVPWTSKRSNESILKEITLNMHWKN